MGDACNLCMIISGSILLAWFILGYVVGFAVCVGRCNAYDGLGDPEPPSKGLIACHWLMFIGGATASVGLILIAVNGWFAMMTTFGGMMLLFSWIVSLVYFFQSDHYEQDYTVMSLDTFNEMADWALNDSLLPRYEIYGYGNNSGSRKRRYRCKTRPVYVPTNYSRDVTEPLVLTPDVIGDAGAHVVTTIDLRLRSGGDQLQRALDAAIACVDRTNVNDGFKMSLLGDIPGYQRRVIVTKDGKKPSVINKHAARAAAVFGPAILYSYDVSRALPHIQYTITRYVDIDLIEQYFPPFECSMMGGCVKY